MPCAAAWVCCFSLVLYSPICDNVAFPLREHTDLPTELLEDLVMMKLHAVRLRGAARLMTLLLCWARAAKVAGRQISIEHTPPGLISLAALYGIDTFFPLTDGPHS